MRARRMQALLRDRMSRVTEDDGALVIFTTGSTGSPKPALLSHRNITVQNMCMCGAFFGGDRGSRTLVNLPASHVGGQTEALMSTFFGGGTAVLLEVFDAGRSLRAIAQHRVEILGQIPAMFNLEWMLKDYDRHDLSSLQICRLWRTCGVAAVRGPACRHGAGDRHRAGAHRGRRLLHLCSGQMRPAGRRFWPGLARTCRSIPAPFASPCAPMATPAMNCPPARLVMCAFAGRRPFLAMSTIPQPPPDDFARRLFIYRRSWVQGRRRLASDRPGEVGDQVVWLPDIPRRCGSGISAAWRRRWPTVSWSAWRMRSFPKRWWPWWRRDPELS